MKEIKKESLLRFFQQSAWVTAAATISGVFNAWVHKYAGWMGTEHYGAYNAVLQAWILMAFLAPVLQVAFSQLAASAEAKGNVENLWGPLASASVFILVLWVVLAGVFLAFKSEAERSLHVSGWLVMGIVLLVPLFMAFVSMLNGVLQGIQAWPQYGLLAIFSGFARLAFVLICFGSFGVTATSAIGGALAAFIATAVMAFWFVRGELGPMRRTHSPRFRWGPYVWKFSRLGLGLLAGIVLVTLDTLAVRRYFQAESGFYGAASLVGRVLVPLSASLLVVMFPKVVRGKVLGEKTHALLLTLGEMLVALISATALLWFFPEWPIRVLQGAQYLAAAPLVPWYCCCVIPMSLAQILLYNLLAQERFAAVPVLLLTALGYAWALFALHDSLKQIIQVMGAAGLVFLAVTAFFTWGWKESALRKVSPPSS